MAEPSAPPPPGSRAIKIPLNTNPEYRVPGRRRRSERYIKNAERAESSDAGSLSLGSDQESAWPSYNSAAGQSVGHRFRTMVSPGQDQLPPVSSPADSIDSTQRKDKQKAAYPAPSATAAVFSQSSSPLGPSMLASGLYKSINLNSLHDDPDEPPRLITYTKHSQGFTWNDELFLPSYMLGRYGDRGRKKQYDGDFGDEEHCPVAEIFITDEEAEAMIP
ncbi:hypothetical protein PV08_10939 [Exophiala spinifera]|uniref:Uncharacterized protein n=1 Tax=Exophiala spinifera TaxID=91928 RepID=A0A0D1ZF71_9EURO|nr:uncharacterized protein PV08_10939 [Exophiala spinifera]KIW11637.1 hypothetical protein PV08_10939 [Exophiala spinifera]